MAKCFLSPITIPTSIKSFENFKRPYRQIAEVTKLRRECAFWGSHKEIPDTRPPLVCTHGKAFLMLLPEHWEFPCAGASGSHPWGQMSGAWMIKESGNSMGEWCQRPDMPAFEGRWLRVWVCLIAVGVHSRF